MSMLMLSLLSKCNRSYIALQDGARSIRSSAWQYIEHHILGIWSWFVWST